ncbi:hypothetical protein [Glaciimonas soli]|uniref:hypothetical protein n=1 Tax=Glaciimonas soli TaxID=2590999 RepID=UPI001293489D|nr:hypothetical protein [Glaciimonas soli]
MPMADVMQMVVHHGFASRVHSWSFSRESHADLAKIFHPLRDFVLGRLMMKGHLHDVGAVMSLDHLEPGDLWLALFVVEVT